MNNILFPPDANVYGIEITYHNNTIIIDGYVAADYDGMDSAEMPLAEFFRQLGITYRDCERAFAQ